MCICIFVVICIYIYYAYNHICIYIYYAYIIYVCVCVCVCMCVCVCVCVLLHCAGWLLTRPPAHKDVIYSEFEAVFPKLYMYVLQYLEPKMEVGSQLCNA